VRDRSCATRAGEQASSAWALTACATPWPAMLRKGASLVDIGQVLRHKHLESRAIYAKVDLARLRQVAQPWPGAAR
jgi:site-specific recombinase XerD